MLTPFKLPRELNIGENALILKLLPRKKRWEIYYQTRLKTTIHVEKIKGEFTPTQILTKLSQNYGMIATYVVSSNSQPARRRRKLPVGVSIRNA